MFFSSDQPLAVPLPQRFELVSQRSGLGLQFAQLQLECGDAGSRLSVA